MAYSESKRRSSGRPFIAELLLLSAACLVTAVGAASQKVRNAKTIEPTSSIPERESADTRKRPLLRQEQAAASKVGAPPAHPQLIEVTSRGSARITSEQRGIAMGLLHTNERQRHRHRSHRRDDPAPSPSSQAALKESQSDQTALPDGDHTFTKQCTDYPRDSSPEAADPVASGQFMCAGNDCKETEYPAAADQCCNCDGGAQYRVYKDTQCVGEDGLSEEGKYDGDSLLTNPQPFQDVRDCMMTCWQMGSACTGISIVNFDSGFAGKCFFRKGDLDYVHEFKSCHNASCEQREVEVGPNIEITTPAPDDDTNDTRVPYCDDDTEFSDLPCTDNMAEARPKTFTTTTAPPTQDEVVDDRDCWVKYLWWR